MGQRPSSLIIKFKQVIKRFLVWNIHFIIFSPVVDSSFYKGTIKSNCVFLSCYVRVSEWICSLEPLELESIALSFLNLESIVLNLLKLLEPQSESISFRTSCSKQVQYLKFKWTVTSWKYIRSNIAQTSSLCYVTGLDPALMKMCSAKEF